MTAISHITTVNYQALSRYFQFGPFSDTEFSELSRLPNATSSRCSEHPSGGFYFWNKQRQLCLCLCEFHIFVMIQVTKLLQSCWSGPGRSIWLLSLTNLLAAPLAPPTMQIRDKDYYFEDATRTFQVDGHLFKVSTIWPSLGSYPSQWCLDTQLSSYKRIALLRTDVLSSTAQSGIRKWGHLNTTPWRKFRW